MRMIDIITKKRDGFPLNTEEINFFIEGYTKGIIPDYQASALAMAIYFKGMTPKETADLTLAMMNSGDRIDLSAIEGIKVDKHSTGGVGDTTTLVLAPLVASVGVPVAKMSGRGLGHTGGTIDKLESIKGFHVELSQEEFLNLVNKDKLAVVGQSGNLTPADKKLYSLRDVTGTVDSIPLIASSIMSKKLAAGADAIVLDVKTGAGAFMKSVKDAETLAREMVSIGKSLGRDTIAIISDMSQPLGRAIGNALEVREAIDTLKGEGPEDLRELVLTLGANMVLLAKKANSFEEARSMLETAIADGSALAKFKEFVVNQGGDANVVNTPSDLPQADYELDIIAEEAGYVSEIAADAIGIAAMKLGAGRATKEDTIDLAVGIVLHKKVGDKVEVGDVLARVYSNDENPEESLKLIMENIHISDKATVPKLIHKVIKK